MSLTPVLYQTPTHSSISHTHTHTQLNTQFCFLLIHWFLFFSCLIPFRFTSLILSILWAVMSRPPARSEHIINDLLFCDCISPFVLILISKYPSRTVTVGLFFQLWIKYPFWVYAQEWYSRVLRKYLVQFSEEPPDWFPECLHQLAIPSSVEECSSFSTSTATPAVSWVVIILLNNLSKIYSKIMVYCIFCDFRWNIGDFCDQDLLFLKQNYVYMCVSIFICVCVPEHKEKKHLARFKLFLTLYLKHYINTRISQNNFTSEMWRLQALIICNEHIHITHK